MPTSREQTEGQKKAMDHMVRRMEQTAHLQQKHALFDPKQIKAYDRGLQAVETRVRSLKRTYAATARELTSIDKQIDSLKASGDISGVGALEERKKLLTRQQSGTGAQLREGQKALVDALQQSTKVQESRQVHERQERQRQHQQRALLASYQAGRGGFMASAQSLWQMRRGGSMGGLSGMAKRGHVAAMVAGAGVKAAQWAWSRVKRGEAILGRFQEAQARSFGLLGRGKGARFAIEHGVRKGRRLAYARDEVNQIIQATVRATGNTGRAGQDATSNMQMMRAFGMDLGSLIDLQRTARTSGDKSGASQINTALAQSLKAGEFPRALAGELAQASSGLMQDFSKSQERVSARGVMGLIAGLSKQLGGVFKQSPQRTAGLIRGMGNFIRNPGGDGMQSLILRSLGMGKDVNFLGARARQRQGATVDNLKRMVPFFKRLLAVRNRDGSVDHKRSRERFVEALTTATRGEVGDVGAKALYRADISGLTKQKLAQMQGKQKTNIAADAKQIVRPMTVKRRQNDIDRADVKAARDADKLLTRKAQVLNTALGGVTTQFERLGNAMERVIGLFSGKRTKKQANKTSRGVGSIAPELD